MSATYVVSKLLSMVRSLSWFSPPPPLLTVDGRSIWPNYTDTQRLFIIDTTHVCHNRSSVLMFSIWGVVGERRESKHYLRRIDLFHRSRGT